MSWFRRRDRYDDDYGHHHHRHHRRRHVRHATFTGFLLFASFLLFLLVGISLPIIKPIYLLQLNATPAANLPVTSIGTEVRFGVWGFCVTSALNPPTFFTNNGDCYGPQLGYTISPDIIALLTSDTTDVQIVLKGLTILLVLHPVASGLALLTLLPIALTCCVFHPAPWIISLILSIVTAIVSSVVLAADLALVIVARDRLKDIAVAHLTADWGNGVWLVVAAVALSWLSVVFVSARVCGCCGYGRCVACTGLCCGCADRGFLLQEVRQILMFAPRRRRAHWTLTHVLYTSHDLLIRWAMPIYLWRRALLPSTATSTMSLRSLRMHCVRWGLRLWIVCSRRKLKIQA
ncbi:hypothetical protein BV25DRAFT_1806512 [Artomyces pyxidatus]|uniref:Uncharacterized protein n=1 Tax=Artomyces pyxidatus TaxID=48021 RepID=A0ACB8SYR7_9AGAM|nr:hypothetical protein BV25DRAFT_1806512 [Artomyces pyxidatus]